MGRKDEIKARLEAATPEPWEGDVGISNDIYRPGAESWYEGVIAVCNDGEGNQFDNATANCALIANAPADLAWCLARIEKLESALRGIVEKAQGSEPGCSPEALDDCGEIAAKALGVELWPDPDKDQ